MTHAEREITRILTGALARLSTKERRSSIRSVARRVSVSPSYLSKIFRGERPLTAKRLPPLAKALQLDRHEVAHLERAIIAASPLGALAKPKRPKRASSLAERYQDLGREHYWMLEEWHHIAILNLATTVGFVDSAESIARRLGIPRAIAEASLEKLIANGFLRRTSRGIERMNQRLRFPANRSHPSLRAYHKSTIAQAARLLNKTPTDGEYDDRLIASVSFAGDPTRMEEAKMIVEEAIYRAAEHMAGGDCSDTYQVNLQLFKTSAPADR